MDEKTMNPQEAEVEFNELSEEKLEQVAGGIPVCPIPAAVIWKNAPFKPGQLGPTSDE